MVEGAERCGGAGAHGNDDLLVGYRRAVAGSEDTRNRCLALGIDLDFAELQLVSRQLRYFCIEYVSNPRL